jgi:antitoxin (DNA-binding transcriptional repressor) of toxin-antitoxin stability system
MLLLRLLPTLLGVCCLYGADEGFVLHDATPVRLKLTRNLSSADAKTGETVDFEVLDDVKMGDTLIIARGGTAIATVTRAEKKKRMARGGHLDVNIDYVRLVNGDKVSLRAVKETSGGGHTGAMTGGIVATSLVFFPAAPFFLFMHGKDTTIPKGTEITAYTDGDIKLDPTKFSPATVGTTAATPEGVKSSPPGTKLTNADIVTLKSAGFSDEVIVSKIKASAADYTLEVNDLLELKKANVSEAVISAMIGASKQ